MPFINGGVTAAKGFTAAGIHAGIRKNKSKLDLALLVADATAVCAATYTTNVVKADPLLVTQQHLANGQARAVVINSGNANACAIDGYANAQLTAREAAAVLGVDPTDVLVASTGVIGQRLPVETIVAALPTLSQKLSVDGAHDAALAIMTTDTTCKECAVTLELSGVTVTIGGMAKGSGMIHPNMGTMLAFVTTDCAIERPLLQQALRGVTDKTFNRVSVDGDTSTNDMCIVMASGAAHNALISEKNDDYAAFVQALTAVCRTLARAMAADGEGASKLLTCNVSNAPDEASAVALAKSVISSSLVKTAMFGRDANWGRVICALGYSGVAFDPNTVDIAFAADGQTLAVCRQGRGLDFDEDAALALLSHHEVDINVDLHAGNASADAYGCDLTYGYVKINGDYRT